MIDTIISGGQTGADRGGLIAAAALGLKRGGWAPLGWRAEDGVVPMEFRVGMLENGAAAYPVRTKANVSASGGTLIVSFGMLTDESGSMLTARIARTIGKPCLHMTISGAPHNSHFHGVGGSRILAWLEEHKIRTLNVAGPRESREPGIQAATCAALVALLGTSDEGFGFDP